MKLLTVLGARPQFIKAAPVSRALAAHSGIRELVAHTGQHYDASMSQVFFDDLGMAPPTYNLDIRARSHGAMTGRMVERVEEIMQADRPDAVMVYGDTNSTLAGALAGAKLNLPVLHVEAGLRSFNRAMPEEINRVLTDHVSTLLLCPTRTAVDNLAREGIHSGVHWTGDVMYDTVLLARERAQARSGVLAEHGLAPGGYALATVHRAENTDTSDHLRRAISYLDAQVDSQPVALPLHPRTKAAAERHGLDFGRITLLPPVGVLDMAVLLANCTQVFTDSGGVQKEAYFHGRPCVTLRSETEWTETVACGWNRLWSEPEYLPRQPITDYGGGTAAGVIADIIARTVQA